jgi:NTP pyrophosphatase (non-canonical NTP hydrolase)
MNELKKLMVMLNQFYKEREWEQFHSPKNISMALVAETAEILEIFQWSTEKQSGELDDKKIAQLKEEIGDVMIYLLNLSSKFNINPVEAAFEKMRINAIKYPVELSKGNSKKYNEL